jgi:hypothetical protein
MRVLLSTIAGALLLAIPAAAQTVPPPPTIPPAETMPPAQTIAPAQTVPPTPLDQNILVRLRDNRSLELGRPPRRGECRWPGHGVDSGCLNPSVAYVWNFGCGPLRYRTRGGACRRYDSLNPDGYPHSSYDPHSYD